MPEPAWLRGPLLTVMLVCLATAVFADCEPPADGGIPDIALETFASGFERPVHLTHDGTGGARLYVVEQQGRIRIVDSDGTMHDEAFLDITRRVSSGDERGLLSIAFHPDYKDNGYLFVNYTTRMGDDLYTRVSRFSRETGELVDEHSEEVILEIRQPFNNHNGGQITFGPDGYLYVGMGDGGSANDPEGHGQNLGTLLGALLRIDVDPSLQGPRRYAIPPDNPYVGIHGARDEIWAHGLRNPWRFSFDRRTRLLYLADVGQDNEEEINIITQGGNYGWPIMEGRRCNAADEEKCERRDLMDPILTYGHADGVAVTGGYVYRGNAIGELCGAYVYGDYGAGTIWGLRYATGQVRARRMLLETGHAISSFGEGPDDELYLLDHKSGAVLRLMAATR